MKKWLVGIFVTAFILSLSSIVLADSVRDGGTCSDHTSDGYEICTVTYHVGDNKDGGRDDYDLTWKINWKARTGSTVYIDYMNFKASGVDSGNGDYLVYEASSDGKCGGKRLNSLGSNGCTEQWDNWYYGNPLEQDRAIVDPENGNFYYPNVFLNPDS